MLAALDNLAALGGVSGFSASNRREDLHLFYGETLIFLASVHQTI